MQKFGLKENESTVNLSLVITALQRYLLVCLVMHFRLHLFFILQVLLQLLNLREPWNYSRKVCTDRGYFFFCCKKKGPSAGSLNGLMTSEYTINVNHMLWSSWTKC